MKLTILLAGLMATTITIAQNVGIGTNTPDPSAILDISSAEKGLLIPRMTTLQRTDIPDPAIGLMVYDTDTKSFWSYNGVTWAAVGGGLILSYEATVNLANSAFKITNSGTGAAIQAITTNEFGYGLLATNTANYGYSVYAYSRSPNGVGLYANVDSSTAVKATSTNGIGLYALSTDSIAIRAAIIKGANADPVVLATHAGAGIAIDASSNTGAALRGTSNTTTGTIVGINNNAAAGYGVYGEASNGTGVRGESTSGIGVLGYSNNNTGVSAGTLGGTALHASSISGTALQGSSSSGYGIDVSGKVKIAGGNTNPAAGAVLTSIDVSGNAVWSQPTVAPPKVGFRAYGVSSFETAGTPNNSFSHSTLKKVEFQTESYDTHGDFIVTGSFTATPGKSVFTVPFRGVYHFDAAVTSEDNLVFNYLLHRLQLRLNRGGSISNIAEVATSPGSIVGTTVQISMDVFLEADDMIWVEFAQNNTSLTPSDLETSGQKAFFSGHLIYTQ